MNFNQTPEHFYQCAQAEYLARAILMERRMVERLVKVGCSAIDLAEVFNVPEEQAALRIADVRKLKGST